MADQPDGRCYAMNQTMPLSREFYDRPVRRVARELLGKRLVSIIGGRRTSGLIVETEAYLSARDSACHASNGPTPRNAAMFGPAGHAYIYSIHTHWCFNVVVQAPGEGCAVLVRAAEPIDGVETMIRRRSQTRLQHLCNGPGNLCQSLGINKQRNACDLTAGDLLWIEETYDSPLTRGQVKITTRIGVTSAEDLPLRYVIAGNPFASGPKNMR